MLSSLRHTHTHTHTHTHIHMSDMEVTLVYQYGLDRLANSAEMTVQQNFKSTLNVHYSTCIELTRVN